MNRFDAVIKVLTPYSEGLVILLSPRQLDNFKAAIRLLEEAGKVREARKAYEKFGNTKWHEYMNAIRDLTDAALGEADHD